MKTSEQENKEPETEHFKPKEVLMICSVSLITGILFFALTCIWRINIAHSALSMVPFGFYLIMKKKTLRNFKNLKEAIKIVFTEFLFGMLMAYCLKTLFTGSGIKVNVSMYLFIMIIYHKSEFTYVAFFHTHELRHECYLIFHSKQYMIAHCFSWLEFLLEFYFARSFKNSPVFLITLAAFITMSVGLGIRIKALWDAKSNFHHLVRTQKEKTHNLVTKGIYSWERHPSYLGYFIFAISGQLLLINLVSCVLFAIVLWMFFKARIAKEEYYLIDFFKMDYVRYRRRVKCNLPFIEKPVMSQLQQWDTFEKLQKYAE